MDISSWFGFGGSFCAVLNVVADWAAVASTHQAQSSFRSLSSLRESLSSNKNPAQRKKNKKQAQVFASSSRKLGAANFSVFVAGNSGESRQISEILKNRARIQEDSIIGCYYWTRNNNCKVREYKEAKLEF